MYEFIDTIEAGGTSTLLSLQTKFNGNNLDDLLTDENGRFITTSVGGRGILPRRINYYQTPYQDGARERNMTYDVREITVNFLIEDKTNEGFRERFNRLNELLAGSQKKLEFTDEEAHFVATLQGANLPDENSNSLEGTLLFICTDPDKIKESKQLNLTTSNQTHQITGQAETPWILETTFTANANRFEAWFGDNYLQLNYTFVAGDKLLVDYVSRKVLLNGNDMRKIVSMSSNYAELEVGNIIVRSTHSSILKYDERYY